jgi:hypothetical protein
MEVQERRIGNVEIELRNVGTVHLRLPVSDVKQLMDFIKNISNGWQSNDSQSQAPIKVKSVGIDDEEQSSEGARARQISEATEGQEKIVQRREMIEGRIDTLEEKIATLVDMNRKLIENLNPDDEDSEPKIPSSGTKYNSVLQDLVERFGNDTFTGRDVADDERHVLSILNNKYNALEVAETQGRTNIYRVRKEVMQRILASEGTSNIIEIRGKDRKSCDAFLDTNQKRYPGFTYAFLEGNGLRQKYRLFFKDNSVQLSVTSNLGRFVGNKTNLIVREA